jgi:hypothetical protein
MNPNLATREREGIGSIILKYNHFPLAPHFLRYGVGDTVNVRVNMLILLNGFFCFNALKRFQSHRIHLCFRKDHELLPPQG